MPIAATITGAATLGSGLLSSIFGKKSNDSANQTNLKIAQMNNEWSEKMMDKQNKMNIAQWEREAAYNDRVRAETNEYNSAVNQAARLREAGINPALAMSGVNAGTSQGGSAPSGNSVGSPSPSSAQMRPYDFSGFSRAITDAAMVALQVQKQQAEVTNMNLNNEYLYKSMQNRLNHDFEKYRSQKYDTDYKQMNESTRVAIENEQHLTAVYNRIMADEQGKLVKQQVAYQQLINKNLPEQLSMNLAVLASQRDLNRKNIKYVAEDIVRISLENQRNSYSKAEFQRIKEATITALEHSIGQGWVNSIGSAFGNIVGSIGQFGRKPAQIYSPHNHYTSVYNR